MRAVLLALLTAAACSATPRLETRTFDLQYLHADEATSIIDPYVYHDREGAQGRVTRTDRTISVRETPENLDRIATVLARYDKPKPWVRLHFQIIEANGARTPDPRIAEVETELRKLFRFTGYRLVSEALLSGTAHSEVNQHVSGLKGEELGIAVAIHDVRVVGDTGIVAMHVRLRASPFAELAGQINARESQTLVLGSAELGRGRGTIILAVRPELVRG